MKIYLASRWARRLDLHPIRESITKLGHAVTSRWLDEMPDTLPSEASAIDLADVDEADLLLLWHELSLPVASLYGGMFVEFGYALAKNKRIWTVETTPAKCIFFNNPKVRRHYSWQDCFDALEAETKMNFTVGFNFPCGTHHSILEHLRLFCPIQGTITAATSSPSLVELAWSHLDK